MGGGAGIRLVAKHFHAQATSRPPGSRCGVMGSMRRHDMRCADGCRTLQAALNQLAKNLTCEWAKDGIRAIAVAPW